MEHHTIKANLQAIISYMMALPLEDQVNIQNHVKQEMHKVSPFNKEPVDCVIWVPITNVEKKRI